MAREVPWLIFDGDCAFCTSSAYWLSRRLHGPKGTNARLIPWQFTDLAALGTTAERTQREALWVSTDGTIYGGQPRLPNGSNSAAVRTGLPAA